MRAREHVRRVNLTRACTRGGVSLVADSFPKTEHELNRKFCSKCVSDSLTYVNRSSGQTIEYGRPAQSDPRMRLHGLVLKSRPHVSNDYSLGMTRGFEQWLSQVIENHQESVVFATLYISVTVFLSPLGPVPTLLFASYTAWLQWWLLSIDVIWSFSGMERQCCMLSNAIPFPFTPILILLFIYTLHRQYCACEYFRLKLQHHEMTLLRVEQLKQ
jgi:hypothetical protein